MREVEICEPVRRARSRTLRRSGLAMTDLRRRTGELFRPIASPGCRLTRLRPVASAYDSWRGTLTLSPRYNARSLAWPVLTSMRPGVALGPEVGLDRWEAERALEGLVNGEPRYVELATHLLGRNAGFVLELPEGVMGVVVAEEEYERSVEIGEPVHLVEAPVLS